MTFPFPMVAPFDSDKSLSGIIASLGLGTNLRLALDAGDANSYGGTGQTWADTSGNGYDFYLGATSGSEASDPTFTGTAGALSSSEYFSHDGGDYFTYDSTNETWMNNLHKNNAQFWFLMSVYLTNVSSEQMLWGTGIGGADVGCGVRLSVSGKPEFYVAKGGGGNSKYVAPDDTPNINAWNWIGMSVNEASTGFCYLNGNYNQVSASDTFSAAYTSPSAADASYTMQFGAWNGATNPLASGSRIGAIAFGEGGTITKANMDSIRAAITATRY